ncbi:MAG TPA: OmpA family protein [Gemmatimonadales bacterium]|nr:OmpA family protein [Gemmatimonadales bacterium]
MRERLLLLSLALLILGSDACRRNPEPVPAPEPAPAPPPPPPPPAPTPPPPPPDDSEARAAAMRAALINDIEAPIHFDYDRYDIRPEDMANLDRKAAILNANPALRLRISGHADERGSDEYNLVLGNNRALSARRYLEGKGVAAARIEVTSFGEERPVDPASTEEAWTKNRRDEFEIIAGGDRLVAPR